MDLKRFIFNKLSTEITEPFISILLGARQVGKSTLMKQLEKTCLQKGLSTAFYNLETPSHLEALSGTHAEVIDKLINKKVDVIFIDEFHYLQNASKVFKSIFDGKTKIKIFASGSSSMEIHKHLKESLAGRFRKTMIHPLSWDEAKQIPNYNLNHYCQWGGMPGLLHAPDDNAKAELLENIVGTYITKDIKSLIKEENIRAFNSLLYFLAQNQGSLTVVSNLAREVGLAETTVLRHLEIMSETYVGHIINSYSKNMANELKKSRKCYLYDLGIRNAFLKDFNPLEKRDDKGTVAETFILLQLLTQIKPNMEIRFWRTKKGDEVDFIVVKNRIPHPIEVKSELTDLKIPDGLNKFMLRYKTAPFGIVFNLGITGETNLDGRPIYFKKLTEASHLDFMQNLV